jgi:hypothetical protein
MIFGLIGEARECVHRWPRHDFRGGARNCGSLSRWEEIINLICGAWIMAAPLVLQYGDQLRIWHFGLGGLVVIITILELWQDKQGGGSTT